MAQTVRNKVAWVVFVFLAIGIGFYPLIYLFATEEFGLLLSKSNEVLSNEVWRIAFYGHISFGGIALLSGWSQFIKKLRAKHLNLHRNLGRVYVFSALVSGLCGVYLGFFATGGIISSLGFISLGVIWLFTTLRAYIAVKNKDLSLHQGLMIYSYAACFAAVTLRIWLPFLTIIFGEFLLAYKIVAWLCWVPNMIFAQLWVRKKGLNLV
ncbi:Protein of unknown function DUF2306, membrane [Allomuricauda ruestringensis DSM 13258]|uniref:DUF2306 domain-containing protein n=1 Tax=Allomuricauda ruestringensis (strain DSM 13258 / CIP 107369 / LMG 19739 / B1) TaxID=886377 RepID=G2PSK8_ALLRU|nr:DUF2306 domain-containing protein [Allomuricauda ruestringensis]AEM69681.1 Protein of unknown function DUF2306, membrane [Allomuricauda ruestringensis DSM 13258]